MSQLVGILIAVQCPLDQKVKILTREYELSSVGFFYRGGVKDTMKFVARESLLGLPAGSRHSVTHEDKLCFIQMDPKEKIAAYVFCEKTYPKRIAFKFLNEVLVEFKNNVQVWPKFQTDENVGVPTIRKLFVQYQNPASVDNLTLAQAHVDELEVVLHENLAKLLERQGDLDQLILKSDDLSKSAKEFYTSSKKMNKKCCLIF